MARKRVALSLEIETDEPISTLRRAAYWQRIVGSYCDVHQAQANMVPSGTPKKPTKSRHKTRTR